VTLPTISRRVIYPLQERLLKRPTFPYLETLERTQWLSRAELERLQMEKLKTLLRIAAQHCPWHAERMRTAGLDVERSDAQLTLTEATRSRLTAGLAARLGDDMRVNIRLVAAIAGEASGKFRYVVSHVASPAQ
jgi:phenylacetate-CoA ligase